MPGPATSIRYDAVGSDTIFEAVNPTSGEVLAFAHECSKAQSDAAFGGSPTYIHHVKREPKRYLFGVGRPSLGHGNLTSILLCEKRHYCRFPALGSFTVVIRCYPTVTIAQPQRGAPRQRRVRLVPIDEHPNPR